MARMVLFVCIFCLSHFHFGQSVVKEPNKNIKPNEVVEPVDNEKKQVDSSNQNDKADKKPEVNLNEVINNTKPKNVSQVIVAVPKTPDVPNIKNNAKVDIEGGAVLRGVFVFVGITLLIIMYLTCKTYRKRNRKNVLIKKYGVKTRRSDVEMEPLPLDDDEDDETVFDLGNVNNR